MASESKQKDVKPPPMPDEYMQRISADFETAYPVATPVPCLIIKFYTTMKTIREEVITTDGASFIHHGRKFSSEQFVKRMQPSDERVGGGSPRDVLRQLDWREEWLEELKIVDPEQFEIAKTQLHLTPVRHAYFVRASELASE
jgi:hypothetical protein